MKTQFPRLVELGVVRKPHGLRGAVVVSASGGRHSALGYLESIFVGSSREKTVAYRIADRAWMPKGWRIFLEGIETETEAKTLSGCALFAEREALQDPEAGEYYVCDLIGLEVVDCRSNQLLGRIDSIESSSEEAARHPIQDRWWVKADGDSVFAIPATPFYIKQVDTHEGKIVVDNVNELFSREPS